MRSNFKMNEDAAIRRANLQRLAKARGWGAKNFHMAVDPEGSYSLWPQLLNSPKKSFGEKLARRIEEALSLPRGWLDELGAEMPDFVEESAKPVQSSTGVDHAMSLPTITLAPTITMEQVMRGETLPPVFVMAVPDAALGPSYPAGTQFLWTTQNRPQTGAPIIVKDKNGQVWVRLLAEGDGENTFLGIARGQGYRTLYSERDCLEIVAVWYGLVGGVFPG